MKVLLIYRNRVQGANSIEELFTSISRELVKKCDIVEYHLGSRKKILQDIYNIRQIKADIYHITGEAHYMACFLPKRKTLLTIHDINHYRKVLSGWKKLIYKWIFLSLPLRCTGVLTTISNETKKILREEFTYCPHVTVIENCYNDKLFLASEKVFNKVCPQILHIGTKVNKNLPRLIEAISGLKCTMYIIGKLNDEQVALLEKHKIIYTNVYYISFEQIYDAYVQSDIVSFVSLSEGFGLPILEAQAVGRAVITSNYDPMLSVSAGAACLVDPSSINDIRLGIERVIFDDTYREKMVEAGYHNVVKFTPHNIAHQYYEIYLNMIKNYE